MTQSIEYIYLSVTKMLSTEKIRTASSRSMENKNKYNTMLLITIINISQVQY